jgi:predicted signal transduction protein with EAL and GGDEF domain
MYIILCTRAFHWTLTYGTLNPHALYVEIPLVYYLATVIIETYQITFFRMISPMPCVKFRNVLALYGTKLFAPLPTPVLEVRPL